MEYINENLNEFNKNIFDKKIAVIGLGVSNIPLIDYLYEKKARITVFDKRSLDKLPEEIQQKIETYKLEYSFGDNYLSKLEGFDYIFRSPSCMPYIKEIQDEIKRGAILTSEIEMLLKLAPCKVIGVTGSDGKTTTTSLIYEIVKQGGYNAYLGGNIGIPLFSKIQEFKPEDIIVLELSSFQLMNMQISPNISVITNIEPNHLDIHSSYEEYIDAKKNIFKYQCENDKLVLNYDNDITKNFAKEAKGNVEFFSHKERLDNGVILDNKIIKDCKNKVREHLIKTDDIIIRGRHNYENVCTAIAATKDLVEMKNILKAIQMFKGVEHRLEFIRQINGANWYNDSIGSSPSRTIAGLNSFDEDIILIAGGYDKNLDYTPLAKPIIQKVKRLILIGATASKIAAAVNIELLNTKKTLAIDFCNTLEETITLAKKYSKPGDVVLFSPASASFDMFKNFDERGKTFKKLVNEV